MNLLHGIRVLDLSSVLAGPSVATFFAELGAEVTRFENSKTGGDVTRGWKLSSEDPSSTISAYYASVNYGKNTALVDLTDKGVQQRVADLLQETDILVHNFKHADLAKFNLQPKSLREAYPQLIHCHLTGFASAPDRLAYDVVLQAESGFMSMNGTPDSGPVKMPVALIDVLAAHQMKEGILLALYQRERSQQGCYITVTLEESALVSLTNQATNYLMAQHLPQRMGSEHPNIAPYGDLYTTADGTQVVLAVGSHRQFCDLCDLLALSDISSDPRFSSNEARVKNRSALNKVLNDRMATYRSDEFLQACHRMKIPAGAVNDLSEVLERSTAQQLIREELIEGVPTRRLTSVAFQINSVVDR